MKNVNTGSEFQERSSQLRHELWRNKVVVEEPELSTMHAEFKELHGRIRRLAESIDSLVNSHEIKGWNDTGDQTRASIYPDVVDLSLGAHGIDVGQIRNHRELEEALRIVYSGRTILDLGSSHGGLYHPFLAFVGATVLGVESDQKKVQLGKDKGANIVQGDARDLAFLNERYHIILANRFYCDQQLREGTLAGPEFTEAVTKLDCSGIFIATGLDLYLSPILFSEYCKERGLTTQYRFRRFLACDYDMETRDLCGGFLNSHLEDKSMIVQTFMAERKD